MSSDEQAFLNLIEANPDDRAPRLVYADYLDEHDRPEEANRQRQWHDSREWLKDYAVRLSPYETNGLTDWKTGKTLIGYPALGRDGAYEAMMERVEDDAEVFASGSDLHSLDELRDADEFFKHLAIVLGRAVNPSELSYSCSC